MPRESGLRRAWGGARRWFPWTLRGLGVFALSAAAVWIWGYGEADLLLLALGATGLAVASAATLLVAVGAGGLRRALRKRPEGEEPGLVRQLETGVPVATGCRVSDWRSVPWLAVEVGWERPPGAGARLVPRDGGLVEQVRPEGRWLTSHVDRVWTVRDVFGLAAISFRERRPFASCVLPAVGRLRQAPIVTALTGADGIPWPTGAPEGDRMEIRRYAPGDSARDVMWNVYARTRQLHVRLRERAVDPSRRLVAYLVAGEGDEASAAAARVALETGGFGDAWTFGADGTPGGHREVASALEAVARSGGYRGPCGLARFLEETDLDDGAACVVFVPPRLGPWLEEVSRVLLRRSGRLSVVVGVDRLRPSGPHAGAWRRFAFDTTAPGGELPEELHEVARTLAADAADPPLLVVRATGRSQLLGSREPILGAA